MDIYSSQEQEQATVIFKQLSQNNEEIQGSHVKAFLMTQNLTQDQIKVIYADYVLQSIPFQLNNVLHMMRMVVCLQQGYELLEDVLGSKDFLAIVMRSTPNDNAPAPQPHQVSVSMPSMPPRPQQSQFIQSQQMLSQPTLEPLGEQSNFQMSYKSSYNRLGEDDLKHISLQVLHFLQQAKQLKQNCVSLAPDQQQFFMQSYQALIQQIKTQISQISIKGIQLDILSLEELTNLRLQLKQMLEQFTSFGHCTTIEQYLQTIEQHMDLEAKIQELQTSSQHQVSMNAYFSHLLEDERKISEEFSGAMMSALDGLGLDTMRVADVAKQIYVKICAGEDWEEGLMDFGHLYLEQGRSRATSINTQIIQQDDFWK